MPGSPQSDDLHPTPSDTSAFHPAASLLSLALLGAGLTMGRSWPELAAASALLAFAALRVERRALGGEAPFLGMMLRIGDAYADALLTRGYVLGRARRTGLRLRWGLREMAAVLGSAASAAWLVHVP